jgi:hypothetical protein
VFSAFIGISPFQSADRHFRLLSRQSAGLFVLAPCFLLLLPGCLAPWSLLVLRPTSCWSCVVLLYCNYCYCCCYYCYLLLLDSSGGRGLRAAAGLALALYLVPWLLAAPLKSLASRDSPLTRHPPPATCRATAMRHTTPHHTLPGHTDHPPPGIRPERPSTRHSVLGTRHRHHPPLPATSSPVASDSPITASRHGKNPRSPISLSILRSLLGAPAGCWLLAAGSSRSQTAATRHTHPTPHTPHPTPLGPESATCWTQVAWVWWLAWWVWWVWVWVWVSYLLGPGPGLVVLGRSWVRSWARRAEPSARRGC